jgi:hypothetical protein
VSRLAIVLLLLAVLIAPALAEPATVVQSASYNPAIPTMKSVLGYEMGEQFTYYSDLVRYFDALAAASDRLKLEPYGKTYEGRTLYTVAISSPKNLARLDAIRSDAAKLTDPRKTTPEEARRIAAEMPVIVWYSYNVHGNEAASSEAAMQFAYELCASQDQKVLNWLDNAVVVFDPMANPDGRERYVTRYRQALGAYPRGDRFAAEHHEGWPSGRPNHYLFDLNRDWAWLSQTETVARAARYLQWNPQVDVDFHEMGPQSTYFFFPPAKPILPWIAPLVSKWYEIYGKGNAAELDRYGLRYYTKESFDLFYPSYGDIWPSLNGAIGMTYEQGGGGYSGLKINLPDHQRTLTLKDRATGHFLTSLATLNTSVQNRQARLQDYYEFHRAAIQSGQQGPMRAVYLVPGRDPSRIAHVVNTLLRQGIEVERSTTPVDAEDLTSYWGEKIVKKQLPAGTYVVDMAQPAGFLARALLQREVEHSDNLFFYDVSGWALPLAADVEGYTSSKLTAAKLEPAVLGSVGSTVAPMAGPVSGVTNPVAYVFSSDSLGSMKLLGHLLEENVRAYVSLKPFRLGQQQFSAGTVVVPRDTNPADLGDRVAKLAAADRVAVTAAATGLSDDGLDLGSNRVRFLRKPKIAILMDTPTSSTDYGALWYLFEQRLKLPFTPIRTDSLREVDLDEYNVLILPTDNGDGRGYSRALDKKMASKIGDWVRNGGVLIAIRGGAVWASKAKSGLSSVTYHFIRPEEEQARIDEEKATASASATPPASGSAAAAPPSPASDPASSATDADKKKQAEIDKRLIKYADREKQIRSEEIPGTILRATVDTTHPLGFGMNDQMPVLDENAPILDLSAKGENVVYFPKDNLKLSGYIAPENEKKVAQTAFLIREVSGRGSVVLFADNPVFRGFWDGTTRLLLNSIFFGNVVDPSAD